MFRSLIIICLILLTQLAIAQEKNTFTFQGQVLDADTKTAVAYATVQIFNKRKGTASNTGGYFRFDVEIGDEIKISAIGYHPQAFLITENNEAEDQIITILLLPKTYELDSVTVIQMRDNFYLKKPIWDTLDIRNPYLTKNPIDWDQVNAIPHSNITETNGLAGFTITGFLNGFDKDLQQKKYLERFREADKFQAQRKADLEKRFNKELVKEVTDIDDRVIDEFIAFCDFRDGEILRATEYEMTVMILAKYKLFLQR